MSLMSQLRELEKQIAPIAIFVDAMRKNNAFYLEMKALFEKEGLQEVFAELTATFNDVSWDDVKQAPQLFEPTTQHLPNQKLCGALQANHSPDVETCVGYSNIAVYERDAAPGEYFLTGVDLKVVAKLLYPFTPDDSHVVELDQVYRVRPLIVEGERSMLIQKSRPVADFMASHQLLSRAGQPVSATVTNMSAVEFITTKLKISLLKSQAE